MVNVFTKCWLVTRIPIEMRNGVIADRFSCFSADEANGDNVEMKLEEALNN